MLNKSIALYFYVRVWALVLFAQGLWNWQCIHHVQITIFSFPAHVKSPPSVINRHVDKLAMLSHRFDLTHLVVMFTMLIRIVSVAVVLLSNDKLTQIPHDVIAEMVHHFIHDHDVQPLSGKRHSSDADDPHPTK